MKAALKLMAIVLILSGCAGFENRAQGLVWKKAYPPMPLEVWAVVDRARFQKICGRSPSPHYFYGACVQRPTDPFGINGGAIAYSEFSLEAAMRMRGCDGKTLLEHEREHAETGSNHNEGCPQSVLVGWQK